VILRVHSYASIKGWPSASFPVPLDGSLHSLHSKRLDKVGADNILAEPLLLQKLEVLQGGAWVCKVLDIWGSRPVLKIVEICDEGRIGKQFARRKMVEVLGVSHSLDELHRVRTGRNRDARETKPVTPLALTRSVYNRHTWARSTRLEGQAVPRQSCQPTLVRKP